VAPIQRQSENDRNCSRTSRLIPRGFIKAFWVRGADPERCGVARDAAILANRKTRKCGDNPPSVPPDIMIAIRDATSRAGMRVALRVIWAMTILLPCGCVLDGAPFPSFFKITGPGQFEFVASGNWLYPAKTAAGEAERMVWLKSYISEHQTWPSGYTIVERMPQPLSGSPRASRDDQLIRSIRYVGNSVNFEPLNRT
jgi:hypothetical protein